MTHLCYYTESKACSRGQVLIRAEVIMLKILLFKISLNLSPLCSNVHILLSSQLAIIMLKSKPITFFVFPISAALLE